MTTRANPLAYNHNYSKTYFAAPIKLKNNFIKYYFLKKILKSYFLINNIYITNINLKMHPLISILNCEIFFTKNIFKKKKKTKNIYKLKKINLKYKTKHDLFNKK